MKFNYAEGSKLPSDIIKSPTVGRCIVCGEDTGYVEINYDCWMCSTECLDEMDTGYFETVQGTSTMQKQKAMLATTEAICELSNQFSKLTRTVEKLTSEMEDLQIEVDDLRSELDVVTAESVENGW